MIIFPAIDIMGGKPVRLYKGEFSTAYSVAENALETALHFQSLGAEWLHTVDLDGSLKKERVNSEVFLSIAENTNLKVEVGGGIRTLEDIDFYLGNGIERVILGSVALKNPALVKEAVHSFGGDKIVVGIDAKKGYVATEGWTESSDVYFTELAKQMEDIGIKTIIYTDISRDGTLSGPNIKQLSELDKAVSCNVVASGGITDLNDIIALKNEGLYGAICGKSIYSGTLELRDAIEVCR